MDEGGGGDPGIENSQSKFLVGYQKAFAGDLTVGAQYYGELMHRYDEYKDALPPAFFKRRELHQYATLRITKLFKYQTIKLSLFALYSPDEEDWLLMPEAAYQVTDAMLLAVGANLFVGVKDDSALGQHDKNDNIYVLARYTF